MLKLIARRLALGILMLPIVILTTEEALLRVQKAVSGAKPPRVVVGDPSFLYKCIFFPGTFHT